MPAIASTYVDILPATSKMADGIKRALRDVDNEVRQAAKRWRRDMERELRDTEAKVHADTRQAERKVDALKRDASETVRMKVDVDKNNLHVMAGSIRMLRTNLGGVGVAAGAAFAPSAIAATTSAVTQLSGVLALIPSGAAAAGLAIGSLKVGVMGIADAYKEARKAAGSSGADQAAQAKAVEAAHRSLRDAVIDEARAQQDVADARKQARQQLEDLNLELRGGVLDEKEAILQARKAREDLASSTFKTATDYQLAQLRVEQADQRVAEAHDRNIELQQKAAEAQAKGVDGADEVVAANERLSDSQRRVHDAQTGVNDAMSKTSSAASSAAQAMAAISPKAQEFVHALLGMQPALEQLKFTVQDAFTEGFGEQIQALGTMYLPMFQTVMSQMAASANQALSTVSQMLQQPGMAGGMQQMATNSASAFNILSQAVAPIVKAFTDIGLVGSGFLPELAAAAQQAATAFATFINEARASGDLQQWIQAGIDAFKQLGEIAKNVGGIFMSIMQAAPEGGGLLGMVEKFTGLINDFLNSPAGQGLLTTYLQNMSASMSALAPVVSSLLQALAPLMGVLGTALTSLIQAIAPALTQWLNAMIPVTQQLAGALMPVIQAVTPVLAQMAGILAQQMIAGIQQILPVLIPFVEQMSKLLIAVMPLFPPLLELAVSALPAFQGAVSMILPILTKFAELLTNQAKVWVPLLSGAIGALADVFVTKWRIISDAVETAWNIIRPIIEKMTTALKFLTAPLQIVGKVAGSIASSSETGLLPIPSALGPAIGGGPNAQRERRGLAPVNWDAIAAKESSGNWQANTGNGYSGGLQFLPETWRSYGGVGMPHEAPREEQIRVAENVLRGQGPGAWPQTFKFGAPSAATGKNTLVTPANVQNALSVAEAAGGKKYGYGGVGPGSMSDAGPGLYDCSGLMSDIFGALTGRDISGNARFFTTEDDFTKLGFQSGFDQNSVFNIGIRRGGGGKQSHMAGTLAGTNVESGSSGTLFGGQAQGARDFPLQYHLPANMSGLTPATAAYPDTTTYMPDNAVVQHLGTESNPVYVTPAKAERGGSPAEQFGQDFLSGAMEIFGMGDVFPDPTQFGLFKVLKGLMGIRPAGGDGASLMGGGGGGGGGLMGMLQSVIPQPFGGLNVGSPGDAPGQFIPNMPDGDGGHGVVLPGNMMASPFSPTGPGSIPGPGNQPIDNRIDLRGAQLGVNPQDMMQQIDYRQNARTRQPLRNLPMP